MWSNSRTWSFYIELANIQQTKTSLVSLNYYRVSNYTWEKRNLTHCLYKRAHLVGILLRNRVIDGLVLNFFTLLPSVTLEQMIIECWLMRIHLLMLLNIINCFWAVCLNPDSRKLFHICIYIYFFFFLGRGCCVFSLFHNLCDFKELCRRTQTLFQQTRNGTRGRAQDFYVCPRC